MKKILLLFAFLFLLGVSTVHAEGGDIVDIYSNPDEMITLDSAPKAFMYTPPYYGFLDSKEFTVTQTKTTNVNAAFDNDTTTFAHIEEGGNIVIELNEEQNIESFYVNGKSTNIFIVDFYGSKGNLLRSIQNAELRGVSKPVEVVKTVNLLNVKQIRLRANGGYWISDVYEFDINLADIFLPVYNLSATAGERNITINWDLPNHKKLTNVKVNGKSIGKVTQYTQEKLESDKEYEYNIATVYEDGTEINTVYKVRTLIDKTPPGSIKNLKIKQNGQDVELSYDLPTDDDFDYVVIKRDGLAIANEKKSNYVDKNLKYNQEYKYEIIAYDSNRNGSAPVNGNITLITQDVTNLKANAQYNQVELTWSLPNADGFKNVVIYRKNNDAGLFARLFKTNEEPLFETNGTQFKDLTVQPDTSYTYRVASVYDVETQGATVSVKTPKVSVGGGGAEKDENGDYVIKWTSPTTGKIKVIVGGKEYKIVPASDQKIVIPKDKMVFDIIGNPDVKLIPVDDDGNEGIPSKPGGNGTGNGGGIGDIVGGGDLAEVLNPENTVKNGMELLVVVGAFLLLGLAFRVVPKLVKMIRNAFSNKKDERIYSGRRRVEE